MSTSFDYSEPDLIVFTVGTVGPPGNRTFYLQVREPADVRSFKLEKQQVVALADYLDEQLADTPPVDALPDTELTLMEPVVPEWVVGPLGIAYDDDLDQFVVVAEEFADEQDEEDDTATEPATARFRLRRDQVALFVRHARQLVEAGRPPCLLCGQPMDPDGHICPRNN
ncbi:MAG: DUF3090 family protein [Acidimicrobiia bacterium]|nr:DUF3090 family protein [Acidimicrobiia bacterium]